MESRSSTPGARARLPRRPCEPNEAGLPRDAGAAALVWRPSRASPSGTRRTPETYRREKQGKRPTSLLHLLEHDARHLQAASFEPFGEARANARRAEASNHAAITINAGALELKYLLHSDRVALHARHFRDGSH